MIREDDQIVTRPGCRRHQQALESSGAGLGTEALRPLPVIADEILRAKVEGRQRCRIGEVQDAVQRNPDPNQAVGGHGLAGGSLADLGDTYRAALTAVEGPEGSHGIVAAAMV